LEKLVLRRYCHERDCPAHIVRTAAFLTSVPLGIATAVAVIADEVPQEVGDFAILLDSGYGRSKVFWLAHVQATIPYILALSAASFIYIALADLVPSLHRRTTPLHFFQFAH
jgi:zinc and cadmium transporter